MRHTKIFSIAALFVLMGTAQLASAQWYLGPRAGLNMMSISTNQVGTTSSRLGIHGGLTLRKQLSKQINVQMDVLYSQMGGNYTEKTTAGPSELQSEYKYYFDYLQVPLYANIEFPIHPKKLVPYFVKESWSSFHLYGGGFFGYGLGAQSEVTVKTFTDGSLESTNVTGKADIDSKSFNAIDFGIMAGAGFSFKLDEDDKQRLAVDARYLMGLGNASAMNQITWNNRAIQFSLAYTFKLTNRRYIRYKR